ncbi:MAG: O-antigen ligase family protein [Hyphomicrobiaceae bacterium]
MLKAMKAAPAPIWLLVASFLCPTELSLYLAGLRLPPHRVALLILLPIALFRMLSRRDPRLRSYDIVFLLYNVWTIAVFMHHQGQGEGLQFGGSLALESFASYVIARVYVRDVTQFLGSLGVLVAAVGITGLIALPEALLGVHYVHDILRAVTGYEHPIGHETRLFLTRAYGTFDHPIHLGTFTASALAMIWYATPGRRSRRRRTALLIGATLLAVSSAPILCLALQGMLIGWDRVTRGVRTRVGFTLAFFVTLYIMASIVGTRSPLTIIATGFTLDSWTGYYRTVIWEWGLMSVWAHPWLGIGLADWERPDWMISSTVDAFWLVVTMRAGIPAFLLLSLAIALLVRAVVVGSKRQPVEVRRMARGWIMSLIALSLIACTVHLWNVPFAHFFFFLGLSGWIADRRRERKSKAQPVAPGLARSGPLVPPQGAYGRPPLPSPTAAVWPVAPAAAGSPYAYPAYPARR